MTGTLRTVAERDRLTRNRRTAARLGDWLDDVKHGDRLKRLLRAAMVRGLALAAGVDRDGPRVSMVAPVAPSRPPAAPQAARRTCMSFEGCGGEGWVWDPVDGAAVYCDCAAGEVLSAKRRAESDHEGVPARPNPVNPEYPRAGGEREPLP